MQVTYTQGAPPNMFMKDADGNTIEEIGIANWKVEHIEEFRASPPHTLEATHAALRGESAQRCLPLQPPRPLSRASCREARPGGHRVSAGRRWVTFMTRSAKSSLSRWRCAETVVTPFFGIQPCSRARPPAGCSGSYCGCIHRSAPGGSRRRRERRVVVCGLCCAPGTVTGRSFLISDSSFGVVARIVPIVPLFAPAPTPLRVQSG